MRYVSIIALLASTAALPGCVAGDGSAVSLASGRMCGVNDGNCATPTAVTTTTTTTTPVTPPTPPPNTGNTTVLATGDATIALEKSLLVSQKTNPAFSTLTIGSLPNTATFKIDPKSPNSALWPTAKTMAEYVPGTNASAVVGLGAKSYKEYRSLSRNSIGTSVDEELQVWNWKYSYGTQYRDVPEGGEALHQAWSFGGTKTAAAAMPISGTADYNGRFGATAKTWSWIDDPNNTLQTLSANGIWSVTGKSALKADFGSGIFTGTLSPEQWKGWATLNGATGPAVVDLTLPNTPANAANTANKAGFMSTDILLKGTFAIAPVRGNTIVGTAEMDQNNSLGFVTDSTLNPMYAGFYGPTANEVSGIFNLEAVAPDPKGSLFPINDDRRGFIEMSGVFNGLNPLNPGPP
jgi:C-lobe and N-lobe beta barrels of Tf-binding protein B